MIAFAKPEIRQSVSRSCSSRSTPHWHAGFLRLLPAIRHHASVCFRHLDPEAREEAVQEAVANAMVAYARLANLGKEDVAYAGPLANYAVKQYVDGRRVAGRNVRDVMTAVCQRVRGIVVQRLDYFDEESGEWQELIVEDKRATPAEVASVRIDFHDWLRTLPRREGRVALKLASGETTSGLARLFKITAGRVSQLRRELLERSEFRNRARGNGFLRAGRPKKPPSIGIASRSIKSGWTVPSGWARRSARPWAIPPIRAMRIFNRR